MPVARIPTPIVRGRDAELETLGDQISHVREGAGAVVLLEGAAGIGKSRLLEEAVRIGERLSFRVGLSAAERGESMVELGALMPALFDGVEPVLEREALREQGATPEQRYWMVEELQSLLEEAALKAPLLVCIDDLHWADGGTASAVGALPSRLAALPVSWVFAYRPGHGSQSVEAALQRLERGGAEKIKLGPLDRDAVGQVATDFMGADPDHALLEMSDRAQGNPFLLVELLAGLQEEELVRIDSGRAELIDTRLPRRVSETMPERLARASESARQVATAASALGRRFSLAELARMIDRPPASLIAPIEELVRADLLGECEEDLLFRHELTREAVRGSIPVSLLRALDRQAAELLLASGALPVEVAAQLAASAEPGDELAITTLLKAAEALVSSNPGTAADLSQRALELAPAQHPLRGPLVAVTAVSLHAAGRAEEAKAFAETSLRSALPAEQEAEVRFSIAGMFALSPDVRAEASRKALVLDDLSADLRARHLARLVHNLYVADRPQEAHAILDEAQVAVRTSGDGLATFTLALAAGGLEYAGSRFRQSLEMIEAAARAGFASGDYTRERLAQEWRCELMMVLDYVDEPLQLAADNVAAAHRDRQGWVLQVFETWRGRMLLQLGQLNDAAAALDGRFDADNGAVVSILDAAGLVALGRSALHMGDAARTRRTARTADQMLKGGVPGVKRHGAWMLALQAAATGEPERARALLAELDEPARTSILPRNPIDVTDDPQLVRIALAAGDRELAQHGVAAAQHRVQLNPDVRSIAASAAHAGGLLSGSEQDLARAVDLFRDIRRPIALASALEDLSQVRINNGERETGVQPLDEALVLYDHAGAAWDARRARGRLRALGVRRRLVSADRPDSGWAAMTQSELAVARLVAQGLTNREVAEQLFVSPNTVNSHLRQIFAKLQVNSRVDLTRLALEQDRPA